jgi:hypothetical protein
MSKAHHRSMGKRKPENLTHPKINNSVKDLVRNEENEYPVPVPNSTMIRVSPISSQTPTKKSLKEEIMDKITEKHMEKLQDMVNQKIQYAIKKFQKKRK